MKSERPTWWDRTDFCLITLTQDGETHRHYYDTYEDLDYNATFCQFSPNIYSATALVMGQYGWKVAFTIGR